ncbi:Ger(x)C family spore germination protein [Paenibacillus pini]|uniref:Spore germination protein GerKC n=1 Tax=Paenibacillus pini JCM 16418 TaxID=1236976 RepID=W7Z749_9BACL|nr:Ger(x)C family spore germination protein [Paenibacillus pini]GAF10124.1 spore germination protein GerKC [Paenibacillus pini JCM 16418]
MRRIILAAMLLTCPFWLTGCWDRKEINDVAFVMGSAVDREGELYRSTLQIALPGQLGGVGSKGGGGGTGGGNKSYYIESKTGLSLRESNQEIQAGNSRILSFAHRRSLLIGEEFAKQGIGRMMDQFARIPQNRLSSLVAITSGPAYKLLDAEAPMEQFPSEMIRELLAEYTKKPDSLKKLLNTLLSEGIDCSLPYIGVRSGTPEGIEEFKNNIQIVGIALFRGDKMVGKMEGPHVSMLTMAMNQAPNPEIIVDGPGGKGHISIRFSDNTVKQIPVIHGDDVTMHMNVYAKGSIIENNTLTSLSGTKNLLDLEKRVSKEIIDSVLSSIRLLQEKYKVDSMGFGRTISQSKPRDWARMKNRWRELYPDVKVVIHTQLHIENIGAVDKPIGEKEVKDSND